MKRQTKIICTLGPACQSPDVLYKMHKAGMDMARLNFSHGDHAQHQEFVHMLREVNKTRGCDIKILQDLEGFRIRLGQLRGPLELKKNMKLGMVAGLSQVDSAIPLEFFGNIMQIKPGLSVFIDDGKIHLRVIRKEGKKLLLEVEQGGILKSRKGVNIPELRLVDKGMTSKDKDDLEFGMRNNMDFIAQSFVSTRQDIEQVVRLVKPMLASCQIIAKIENRQGIRNLNGIMNACHGILVARGDLGVSLPVYEIPLVQKDIIRRCNKTKKLVITATQMLESMTENNRPTRAEVSDVANAILDGTDYVMLSGETAVGRFPVETVAMMAQIIEYTEKSMYYLSG